jgi:hypothetical protein
MTITPLDPADSVAMGQWYDLMVKVTRHDRVVGAASYPLPHTENLSMVYLDLIVHPGAAEPAHARRPHR